MSKPPGDACHLGTVAAEEREEICPIGGCQWLSESQQLRAYDRLLHQNIVNVRSLMQSK